MSLLHSSEVGNLQVCVYRDPNPESPADWDSLGQIVYTSSRYALGTRRITRALMDQIREGIASGELVGLPVFAYVHSGAMIRAAESNPFSCPWDSGQSGYVYCTHKRAIQEFGLPEKVARREALRVMVREVEVFNQYLQGDVYGYRIMQGDDEVDSCWGLYGLDYAVQAAKEAVEALCRV